MFDKYLLVNYKSVAIIPNAKDTYNNSSHANNMKKLFEDNFSKEFNFKKLNND